MNQQEINEKISAWFEPSLSEPFEYYDIEGTLVKTIVRPDFFTDESANARLLEAMPNVRLTHYKSYPRWEVESDWRFCHTEGIDNDRKTAIVLAFCKFAGIEVAL